MNVTMTALRGIGFAGLLVLTAMSARADWVNKDKKDVLGRPDSLGHHLVDGISGVTEFQLTAKEGHISTPEGNSVYVWGFASGTGPLQYPGPTLIVNQGESIKVTLKNQLPFPVSIVFPGQSGIVSSGGAGPGVIAQEATVGNDVIYTFTAKKPGTYLYNSGTRPDLQTEMGLVGSLIVRPGAASGKAFNATDPSTWTAYGTPDSAFDQEFLFMLTDMDPDIHDNTERLMLAWHAAGGTGSYSPAVDTTHHNANYWFINGRCGPDTMMQAGSGALPAQPYDAFPMMHPGQRLMMRVIGGGRDPHPFHHHGNHAMVIARNGRLLQSSPAAGYSDLAYRVFTTPAYPGETSDGVFTWTGQGPGLGRVWPHRQRGRGAGCERTSPREDHRGGRRPSEALSRVAPHRAGHGVWPLLQRQPIPRLRCLHPPEHGRLRFERRLRLHVALARRARDREQQCLSRRHADHAADSAVVTLPQTGNGTRGDL